MARRAWRFFWLAGLLVPALGLGGCGFGRALGMGKNSPDEFEVVTKAPLVIPPDFSLKPPAPGQSAGPQTEAELIAQKAILGDAQTFTAGMSPGERALLAGAGATHADPLIRQVIDQDYASLIRRGDDFADRLIFWDKSANPADRSVDPGAEERRLEQRQAGTAPIDKIEGQKPPTIQKSTGGIF